METASATDYDAGIIFIIDHYCDENMTGALAGLVFWSFCLFDIIVFTILLPSWLNKKKVEIEGGEIDETGLKGQPEDISRDKSPLKPSQEPELIQVAFGLLVMIGIIYLIWFFSTGQWVPCISIGQDPC